MEDMEVDDDEWQISAWFFRDQAKASPLATLDFQQELFAVTGVFRAQQRDDGFIVFSRENFFEMFGPFPSSFSPENMDALTVCPYDYNPFEEQWTNKITGGHPLIFHFAGNDWLCACSVFAAEGFQGITGKFRDNCSNEFAKWSDRVQHAVQFVAKSEDFSVGSFVHKELPATAFTTERHLEDSPYRRQLHEVSHDRTLRFDGPYRRMLADDGPYRRMLADDGPYRRALRDAH